MDRDVMRQAVTTVMMGFCLILAPWARGGTPPQTAGTGPIPQARRLIEAGNHVAAMTVLEDALFEAPVKDRATILDLLRQSYEILARKTEASGRPREAAHYRDNLAILERSREPIRQSPPIESRPQSPTRSKAAPAGKPASDGPRNALPLAGPASAPAQDPMPGPVLPILSEPAPLPEPERIPPPVSPRGRVAIQAGPDLRAPGIPGTGTVAGNPSPAGTTRLPDAGPPMIASPSSDRDDVQGSRPGLPLVRDPDEADAPAEEINPGSATPDAVSKDPAEPNRNAANPPDGAATPEPAREPPATDPDLDRADRLFTARQYDEAGRVYATLAGQNRLPADRRPHWAYCRAAEVVRKINAHPRSPREWDAIEVDVQEIQRLTPGHWVGEYLRNLVAEGRGPGRRPAARSNNLIVRGSEPDESQAPTRRIPRLFGTARGANNPPPKNGPSPPPAAPAPERPLLLPGAGSGSERLLALNDPMGSVGEIGTQAPAKSSPPDAQSDGDPPKSRAADTATGGGDSGTSGPIEWQVHETDNFRIFHCDRTLARQTAAVAESVRTTQARRWTSPAARLTWTPRCDLYLHPNPKSYAEATGQPEVSPGISTMANNGTRVVSRRMNLRADNPLLLTTTLPHEVTHIVMADVFVVQQIPRWADEGIAVLAEPLTEQRNRVADLQEPLESGQVFQVGQLMKMDYPGQKDWRLFYAQSVSLTRYLVDQGPPERFIQFVRDSQRTGVDAALRDVYQIEGLAELHNRWLAHARKQITVDTASSRDADSHKPSTTR
jgi:hypothetical protein